MLTKGTPLQTLGATRYSGAPGAGTVVLVTAAANTKGVIIRTLWLCAGASSYMNITLGAAAAFTSYNTNSVNYMGPGILVPPGLQISVGCSGAGNNYDITADILT